MTPDVNESALADERHFALLEAYLFELHAGRQPDRGRLLAEHPELATMLACLEDLDQLAPPPPPPDLRWKFTRAPAAPTVDHAPAQRDFGKYELLAELGRGGMGVVFKAREKDLDRVVAIKMILSSQLASPEQVDRFQAEAKAAARLHHPHIVAVYEVGQVHGQPFFAMQFVEGISFAQQLAEWKLTQRTLASQSARSKFREALNPLLRLFVQVARAVQYLHDHKVVHRDLKPANILLDATGQPYVTDFGLVKLLATDSHRTNTGAIMGTPSYMAPEQAAGRTRDVGPHSDLFSLGAILYEMLTGVPPFHAETPLDTIVQVIEGEPTRPSQRNRCVPVELEMICLKCLEKNPADRYGSATALADDVERYLKGEEVEARSPGLVQKLRRWTRREPSLVSRLGALTIFAIVAQLSFQFSTNIPFAMHVKVMLCLGAWAGLSFVYQQLLHKPRWAELARYAWAATDTILFTIILIVAENFVTPLVIGYASLIAASGLWFRVALVWFTTVITSIAYLTIYVLGVQAGVDFGPWNHHVIVLVIQPVLGAIVAYQVNRIRVLSRYYESRPLP